MSDEEGAPARALDIDVELTTMLQKIVKGGLFYQSHVSGEHVWSDSLLEHLQLPESFQISPETFVQRLHPDDYSVVLESAGRAQKDPSCTKYILDFRFMHGDGEYRRMRAHCHLTRDEHGLVITERGVLLDITEQWELEQELRSAQRRSAAGRVAAGVAHDFNNLLSGILGEASLQLMDELEPEQREAFQSIVDITERATSLTNQLLMFTRRQVAKLQVVEIDEAMTKLSRLLERVIDERCELRFELASQGAAVRIDRTQLEQVVVNLVVNARDALVQGGLITISCARVHRDGHDWARLVVEDSGEGMSPEVLARAQEEFFTTKAHGTGLGLAISKQILSELGGRMALTSRLGAGTQVELLLPLVPDYIVRSKDERKLFDIEGEGHSVLVVDDEPLLVRLALRGMRGFSFRAHGETEREAALRWLDAHPEGVDALVTDVVMPGMGLREFITAFIERCPDAAIITISGYAPDSEWDDTLPDYVQFVPKPFTPVGLSQAVQEAVVERRRSLRLARDE